MSTPSQQMQWHHVSRTPTWLGLSVPFFYWGGGGVYKFFQMVESGTNWKCFLSISNTCFLLHLNTNQWEYFPYHWWNLKHESPSMTMLLAWSNCLMEQESWTVGKPHGTTYLFYHAILLLGNVSVIVKVLFPVLTNVHFHKLWQIIWVSPQRKYIVLFI